MISSMRDSSVARTACGTLAGSSTTDCGVVCTLTTVNRQDERPRQREDERSERRRVLRQLLTRVEGKQGDVARRRARQHTAGNPSRRWRHQAVQGQDFTGLQRARHTLLLTPALPLDPAEVFQQTDVQHETAGTRVICPRRARCDRCEHLTVDELAAARPSGHPPQPHGLPRPRFHPTRQFVVAAGRNDRQRFFVRDQRNDEEEAACVQW